MSGCLSAVITAYGMQDALSCWSPPSTQAALCDPRSLMAAVYFLQARPGPWRAAVTLLPS